MYVVRFVIKTSGIVIKKRMKTIYIRQLSFQKIGNIKRCRNDVFLL